MYIEGMTNAAKPFTVTAQYDGGCSAWTGGRTRSYATQAAAETAARKLSATIQDTNPKVATVTVQEGLYGPTLATFQAGP